MMSGYIQPLSVDADFKRFIFSSDVLITVHSQFCHVINIYHHSRDEIYTLASAVLDDAPNTMRLNITNFSDFKIKNKSRIMIEKGALLFENQYRIPIKDQIPIWQSKLNYSSPKYSIEIEYNAVIYTRNLILDFLQTHASSSLFFYLGDNSLSKHFKQHLQTAAYDFIYGIQQQNDVLIQQGITKLVGCGVGLTPSGDDFIVGVLSVFLLVPDPSLYLIKEAIQRNKHHTTEISYTMLYKASQGKFRQNILNLLDAIIVADICAIQRSIRTVFMIGSSSGSDILYGIYLGLILLCD